jgi:uncharacterized protein (TIGR02118 family)
MARMVVIYQTPPDIEAFNRHYYETHIPLAKRLPGLRSYEVSQGAVVSPIPGSDVFLVGTLTWDSMADLQAAFASPEGQACRIDREKFAPDTDRFQMLLFEDRAV